MGAFANAIAANPLNPAHALIQQQSQQALSNPITSATGNPQLDAILEAARNTPGASATFGSGNNQATITGGSAGGTGTQTPPDAYANFFGGQSPWQTGVTSPTWLETGQPGPTYNVGETIGGAPNINFTTEDAGTRLANTFGANLVRERPLSGTGLSRPTYSLDFGAGDPQSAGQIAYWMQRGDRPEDIMARLQAGLAPPLARSGAATGDARSYVNDLHTTENPFVRNLQAGQASGLVPGVPGNLASSQPSGPFANITPSTHLGTRRPASISEQNLRSLGSPDLARMGGGPTNIGTTSGGQQPPMISDPRSAMFGGPPHFGGGADGGGGMPSWMGGGGFGSPGGGSDIMSLIASLGGARGQAGSGFMRRPMLPYGGGRFLNSWYYPRSEPNMSGLAALGGRGGGGYRVPGRMGQSYF